jgi:hypothetical protein
MGALRMGNSIPRRSHRRVCSIAGPGLRSPERSVPTIAEEAQEEEEEVDEVEVEG